MPRRSAQQSASSSLDQQQRYPGTPSYIRKPVFDHSACIPPYSTGLATAVISRLTTRRACPLYIVLCCRTTTMQSIGGDCAAYSPALYPRGPDVHSTHPSTSGGEIPRPGPAGRVRLMTVRSPGSRSRAGQCRAVQCWIVVAMLSASIVFNSRPSTTQRRHDADQQQQQ